MPRYPSAPGPSNPESDPQGSLFGIAKSRMEKAIRDDQWGFRHAPVSEEGIPLGNPPAYLYAEFSSDPDSTRNGEPGTIVHLFLPQVENTTKPVVESLDGRHWFVKGIKIEDDGSRREEILVINKVIGMVNQEGEPVLDTPSFLCSPASDEPGVLSPEAYLAEKLAFYRLVPILT